MPGTCRGRVLPADLPFSVQRAPVRCPSSPPRGLAAVRSARHYHLGKPLVSGQSHPPTLVTATKQALFKLFFWKLMLRWARKEVEYIYLPPHPSLTIYLFVHIPFTESYAPYLTDLIYPLLRGPLLVLHILFIHY